MKITLASVISLNGKITKGANPDIHAWSSKQDWEHFVRLRDEHDAVIIDLHTFETVHPQPEKDKLRMVMTDSPDRFESETIAEQLEFTGQPPEVLVSILNKRGYQKGLVAGGADICSRFLAAGLVDDIYVTVEPVLFGSGNPMLSGNRLDISL